MTDAELTLRLSKFKRRAPMIQSQQHLEKIIGSFPAEHRTLAIQSVSGMLSERLEAKESEAVQIKPANPDAPTIQEETAMRLTAHAAKILEQEKALRENADEIKALKVENQALKDLLDEKDKAK